MATRGATAIVSESESDDEDINFASSDRDVAWKPRSLKRTFGLGLLALGFILFVVGLLGAVLSHNGSDDADAELVSPLEAGMIDSGPAQFEYEREPYCRDVPSWADGSDCLSQGTGSDEGCTTRGWTCAGYKEQSWCDGGKKTTGAWAFGPAHNRPEASCCECGGSERRGGSCQRFGCLDKNKKKITTNRNRNTNDEDDATEDEDQDAGQDPFVDKRRSAPRWCQCYPGCAKDGNCCYDYEATCVLQSAGGYRPADVALLKPSAAPAHTFYVYRAQTTESFPPTNVNAASLGAVLWYLHNEVVPKCPRRGTQVAAKDISRILRYKVTTKATTPLFARGMNFGVKSSYDYGASTGPGNRHGEDWATFGYFVGCNVLGSWPHESFADALEYPLPIWYSLPGVCPNADIAHKRPLCVKAEPGGHCAKPTGAGDCTYSFEEAGEIDIDELVGITPAWPSHDAFCEQGCREYDRKLDRGHCMHWWDGKHEKEKNLERVRKADELFAQKYPHMPKNADLPPPPCDFNKDRFYKDFMPRPP